MVGSGIFVFLLLASLVSSGTTSAHSVETMSSNMPAVVDLDYAKYKGNITFPRAVAYLGIPYAEPPLGNLRYRAPLSLNESRIREETHGSVVDARSYPLPCVQGALGIGDAGGAGVEDCLKVNIYAPLGAKKGDKLPVVVYFHGGAFILGSPATTPFDHWIQQSPNIVAVVVYYRLDSFGFLPFPTTNSSIADHNAGLLDQTSALGWVQRHIDSFGGDSGHVTLNGQSAGGASVEYHLIAPGNDELFHAAIPQSVYRVPFRTVDEQQVLYQAFLEAASCNVTGVEYQLECLRQVDIATLSKAQDSLFHVRYDGFHPVLDGKVIPEYPTVAIKNGRFRHVPLLIGATSNETLSDEGPTISVALKTFFPSLTEASLTQFNDVYPVSDYSTESQQFRAATGESELLCAREIVGEAFAQETPVYAYRFNQANPTDNVSTVEHGADDYFLFGGSNPRLNGTQTFTPLNATQRSFAEELIAYWISFIRTGDPNVYKLTTSPVWPRYQTSGRKRMVLQQGTDHGTGSVVESSPNDQIARCDFVASKVLEEQN